jgi:outer membrane protein
MKLVSKLFFLSLVVLSFNASAQKFGHINSADLLQLMPEVKTADSSLAIYQKSLEDAYNDMVAEYQTKLKTYQDAGTGLADAVKEVKEQELLDLQNRIQTFEGGAQEKAQNKRQELYTPILKRAEDAVKAVAKENNYAYIFDTSIGAVIYAQESDDITALVKKKLGLKM